MSPDAPLLESRRNDAAFDLVGLGEISIDTVARVERWPAAGQKVPITDLAELPGGQIATATLGCARLGMRTALMGVVGRDRGGKRALAPLEEAGVEGQAAPASLGSYSYEKWGGTCSVEVYAMRVTREHEHWLENFRTREWVPLEIAAQRMQESDLRRIMSTLPEHIHAP